MSFRKRKSVDNLEITDKPSKRARILSTLWQSQEEGFESSSASRSGSSSSVYRIKGIIGERKGKYLIDWADDPVTGEKFKADWVSEYIFPSPTCVQLQPLSRY